MVRQRSITLWILVFLFSNFLSVFAYAKPPVKQKISRGMRQQRQWTPFVPMAMAATPPQKGTALLIAPVTTKRLDPILNIRLHPIYLGTMLLQKDTVVAGRADLDFVLGNRVTLGPSVIFNSTSTPDSNDNSQYLDEQILELGLLSNIYLTGKTSTGGFILRPHVYWIDAMGDKVNADDEILSSSSNTNGLRGGSEIVYQLITTGGLNFEVGGGFTYHLVPYQMNYTGSGTSSTEPVSRISPTLTVGIGWAF